MEYLGWEIQQQIQGKSENYGYDNNIDELDFNHLIIGWRFAQ